VHITLKNIADHLGAKLIGNPELHISGISSLLSATEEEISFLSNPKFSSQIVESKAGAVIMHPDMEYEDFGGARLLMGNPYLGYAKVAALLNPIEIIRSGVAESAVVSASAIVGSGGWIGQNSVVEDRVKIGEEVSIAAGCFIAAGVEIGRGTHLLGNVTILSGTVIGEDCIIQAGAVIGSDGFGFAQDGEQWVKIPQLGRVVIGDRVEVGSNSTIDRGALEDTEIADGVKIDNLVHIAHNVRIGENSAMAALVGVAGSTEIGAGCTFGGQAGIVGHLKIAAGVHCTARTLVTSSLNRAGLYSSSSGAEPNRKWRRNVVQLRNLNESIKRLKRLERRVDEIIESGQ
jgi:UDP-3-O-[3-hydroxymyristoyl] glucosamine N-acyltransferase